MKRQQVHYKIGSTPAAAASINGASVTSYDTHYILILLLWVVEQPSQRAKRLI
jgi:hypothetical protein